MFTTGNEDAVTVQAGTFSWDQNERTVLEKYVYNYLNTFYSYILVNILFHHWQYQSEHQAWSVGGNSGSRGSWQVITHLSSPWRDGEDGWKCNGQGDQ